MPKNWKTYKLGELCTKITDGAHHSPKDIGTGGYPMPSVKDLTPFGVNLESSKRISELDYFKLIKQGCQPIVNDVVIAKDGNSALDTVCVIKKSVEAVLLSSVAILRPDMKLIDPYFLKCYFSSPAILKYLKSRFISGAAIPRVILKDFKLAEINLPPLPEQRVIASILSALDDKIENNLAMNKTLEDMAMALYKHWFVDFGPFQEGKFVDSELGKIPEGWQVKRIGELISHQKGYAFKSKWYQSKGKEIVRVSDTTHNSIDLSTCNKISNQKAEEFKKYNLKTNDVIIASVGSWLTNYASVVGKVVRVPSTANGCLLNQNAVNLQMTLKDKNHQGLLYYSLKNDRFLNYIVSTAQGSANQASIKLIDIFDYKIPFLSIENFINFSSHVDRLIEQQNQLTEENQTLTQLRDTLLPKLISGEVRLKEFEKEITAAL
ncbi:restriction endonuclease subunit S [Zobellia nedashkovskayae]|uniref:restriction endonuclease subunit S n=1 Tax=Zobellia nedashkovskayae TaxID=2779510 RepID=UPI00188ADCD5|nr:restriction endonuclease subunit S [Zobellia nedashkovskayae]